METKQPVWKCIGHIGDIDPITYGGGFIYIDETNVYGPELTYFEPATDEGRQETETRENTPLKVYRIMLESGPREWFYSELDSIASFTGRELVDVQADANSNDPVRIALLYSDLIHYFGPSEFDSYPETMTEREAYAKYASEMGHTRQ